MPKKLMRSRTNKVIGGVCGGLGEYFDIDPVFVRILAVLLLFGINIFAVITYIVAMIIMPKKELEFTSDETGNAIPVEETPKEYSSWNHYLPGLVLIGFGLFLLIKDNFYWFGWEEFFPLVLVVGGLYLIFRKQNKKEESTIKETTEVHSNGTKTDNGGSPA